MITAKQIKQLRDKTGISMAACKAALEESGGDIDAAISALGKRGALIAGRKQDRSLGAGVVAAYVHNTGRVAAMVDLACETDFVARNEEFRSLAYDLAMHVAAANPENIEELMEQEFIKDPSKKIKELITAAVQKFGENTSVRRIERFAI